MIRSVIEYFRPPPIGDAAALSQFLGSEAAYVAQRSTYELSRNMLAWLGQWAFGDQTFNDTFRICRWEAFAAVLADMTVLTQGQLARAAPAAELAPGLAGLYTAILLSYPVPAHRPQGWADAEEQLGIRLRHGVAADPTAIGRLAARRIFDLLPVQSRNPEADYAALEAAIRFGTVSFYDRLVLRLRPEPLAADLLQSRPALAAPLR